MVYQENNTEAKMVEDNEEIVAKALEMLRQAQNRMDHQLERCKNRLQMVLRPAEEVRGPSPESVPTRQPSQLVEALQMSARHLNDSADVLSEMLSRCDL